MALELVLADRGPPKPLGAPREVRRWSGWALTHGLLPPFSVFVWYRGERMTARWSYGLSFTKIATPLPIRSALARWSTNDEACSKRRSWTGGRRRLVVEQRRDAPRWLGAGSRATRMGSTVRGGQPSPSRRKCPTRPARRRSGSSAASADAGDPGAGESADCAWFVPPPSRVSRTHVGAQPAKQGFRTRSRDETGR